MNDFLQEHPDITFISKEVFFACCLEIKPLLNLNILVGYLMKHGVVRNAEDMESLTSSFFKSQDKFNSLVKMVEAVGNNGFMLLYICLMESAAEVAGHQDAIRKLDNTGNGLLCL